MAWVKLDDGFFLNPKIVAAGRDARDMYLAGLTYSAGQLTDGFLGEGVIPLVAAMAGVSDARELVERLVELKLWEAIPGGYQIHDYHDYNPSAAKVRALRKARAEAGRKGGRASGASNTEATPQAKAEANEKPNRTPSPSPSPSPDPDCSCGSDAHAREDSETADALSSFIATAAHDFENCIGLIAGEHQSEEITAYATDLHNRGHPEWWQMALDVACDNNARKWSYVRAVLQNWLEQGRPGLKPPANGSRASPEEYDEAAALEKAARYGLGVSDGV